MIKRDKMIVQEVYDEYVKNGGKMQRIPFTKKFLKENPEYRVMIGKVRLPDGTKKSVRMFTTSPKPVVENVSEKIFK